MILVGRTVAMISRIMTGLPVIAFVEDVAAAVDMNVVMTDAGRFVEVQGTGEESTLSREELNELLRLGEAGIRELLAAQQAALR